MRVTQKRFLGFLTLLAIATLALFSACTQEKVVDVNPVCFERDILPLLVSSGNSPSAGVNLGKYTGVKNTLCTAASITIQVLYPCLRMVNYLPAKSA